MPRRHRAALNAALIRAAVAAAAAVTLGLWAAPALAAPAAAAVPAAPAAPATAAVPAALPAGTHPSGGMVTCTYTATGEHQFAVPAGVHAVTATVTGGQGGADFGASEPGGLGAVATGTLPATPGQVLFAEVGILGGAAGSLLPGFTDSGAGGGESDVRTCPAAGGQPCPAGSTLASRLLVAGGGGGSGDFGGPPGNAGTTASGGDGAGGADGRDVAGGGAAGPRPRPGAGGAGCDGGGPGSPGAAAGGAGGAAGPANGVDGVSGGGGGAGWFGGGAGGGCSQPNDSAGSGGGGSSHAAASVTGASFAQAAAGKAASVVITYAAPLAITTATLPGATIGASYTATLAAAGGTAPLAWSLQAGSSLPDGLTLSSDGTISGAPLAAGSFSFTVQVADSSSPAATALGDLQLSVATAAPHLALSAAPPSPDATDLQPVTLTASVVAAGTAPAPTGSVTFTVDGTTPPGCGSVAIAGLQAACTVTSLPAGSHDLAVSYPGDSDYGADSATVSGYQVRLAAPVVGLSVSPASGATATTLVSVTMTVSAPGGRPGPDRDGAVPGRGHRLGQHRGRQGRHHHDHRTGQRPPEREGHARAPRLRPADRHGHLHRQRPDLQGHGGGRMAWRPSRSSSRSGSPSRPGTAATGTSRPRPRPPPSAPDRGARSRARSGA